MEGVAPQVDCVDTTQGTGEGQNTHQTAREVGIIVDSELGEDTSSKVGQQQDIDIIHNRQTDSDNTKEVDSTSQDSEEQETIKLKGDEIKGYISDIRYTGKDTSGQVKSGKEFGVDINNIQNFNNMVSEANPPKPETKDKMVHSDYDVKHYINEEDKNDKEVNDSLLNKMNTLSIKTEKNDPKNDTTDSETLGALEKGLKNLDLGSDRTTEENVKLRNLEGKDGETHTVKLRHSVKLEKGEEGSHDIKTSDIKNDIGKCGNAGNFVSYQSKRDVIERGPGSATKFSNNEGIQAYAANNGYPGRQGIEMHHILTQDDDIMHMVKSLRSAPPPLPTMNQDQGRYQSQNQPDQGFYEMDTLAGLNEGHEIMNGHIDDSNIGFDSGDLNDLLKTLENDPDLLAAHAENNKQISEQNRQTILREKENQMDNSKRPSSGESYKYVSPPSNDSGMETMSEAGSHADMVMSPMSESQGGYSPSSSPPKSGKNSPRSSTTLMNSDNFSTIAMVEGTPGLPTINMPPPSQMLSLSNNNMVNGTYLGGEMHLPVTDNHVYGPTPCPKKPSNLSTDEEFDVIDEWIEEKEKENRPGKRYANQDGFDKVPTQEISQIGGRRIIKAKHPQQQHPIHGDMNNLNNPGNFLKPSGPMVNGFGNEQVPKDLNIFHPNNTPANPQQIDGHINGNPSFQVPYTKHNPLPISDNLQPTHIANNLSMQKSFTPVPGNAPPLRHLDNFPTSQSAVFPPTQNPSCPVNLGMNTPITMIQTGTSPHGNPIQSYPVLSTQTQPNRPHPGPQNFANIPMSPPHQYQNPQPIVNAQPSGHNYVQPTCGSNVQPLNGVQNAPLQPIKSVPLQGQVVKQPTTLPVVTTNAPVGVPVAFVTSANGTVPMIPANGTMLIIQQPPVNKKSTTYIPIRPKPNPEPSTSKQEENSKAKKSQAESKPMYHPKFILPPDPRPPTELPLTNEQKQRHLYCRRQVDGAPSLQQVLATDSDGDTQLHIGAIQGEIMYVKAILDRAEHEGQTRNIINQTNDRSHTALFLAVCENQADIVSLLIKHGADPNLQARRNSSCGRETDYLGPLHLAADDPAKKLGCLHRLLGSTLKDINKPDSRRLSPLHHAADAHKALMKAYYDTGSTVPGGHRGADWQASCQAVHLLLRQGADIGLKDSNKTSPLHLLVESGDVDIVEHVLNMIPDTKVRKELLHARTAKEANCVQSAVQGLRQGASPSEVQRGVEMVKLLKSMGADPYVSSTFPKNNLPKEVLDLVKSMPRRVGGTGSSPSSPATSKKTQDAQVLYDRTT